MRNYSIIFILFFFSCSVDRNDEKDIIFRKDGSKVLSEISEMIKNDQDLRVFEIYKTTDSDLIIKRIDSLKSAGLSDDSIQSPFLSLLTSAEKDSVNTVMQNLATKHTARVIYFIKTYGYPTSARFGDSISGISSNILLHHLDTSYGKELLPLLEYELSKGRVDTNTVEMIKWDLQGRVGIPNIKGVNIIIHNSKTGKEDTIRK